MSRLRHAIGGFALVSGVACTSTASSSTPSAPPSSSPSAQEASVPQPRGTTQEDDPSSHSSSPTGSCGVLSARAAPPEGLVHAIVDGVGLVQIDAQGGRVRVAAAADLFFSDMALDAGGALWVGRWSDADLLRVDATETRVALFSGRDRPLLHTLAPRGPDDIWLVTRDIEWMVARYDGRRLRSKRERSRFRRAGGYDDNKLIGFARSGDAVYLSCWNGVWRRDAAGWAELPPPPAVERDAMPGKLFAAPGGVVVSYPEASYFHGEEGWSARALSAGIRHINSDGSIVAAASSGDEYHFAVYSLADPECALHSVPVRMRYLRDVAIDRRGRLWVASDTGLGVVGADGNVAAQWATGELTGLDGNIERLVVTEGGPPILPPPVDTPTWTLEGRLRFSRGGKPVAGRSVLLCNASYADDRCAHAPLVRSATTDADGAFRFVAVPPGDLAFVVVHAEDTPECQSPFVAEPHHVSPQRDCTALTCDLGTRSECRAFEMPPPH